MYLKLSSSLNSNTRKLKQLPENKTIPSEQNMSVSQDTRVVTVTTVKLCVLHKTKHKKTTLFAHLY